MEESNSMATEEKETDSLKEELDNLKEVPELVLKAGSEMITEHYGIIRDYFQFDEKKKTATIKLHYQKASDMFDEHLDTGVNALFSDDVNDYIEYVIKIIPREYRVILCFEIDDMEGYSLKQLNTIIINNIKITHYETNIEIRKKTFFARSLFVIGILLLIASITVTAILAEDPTNLFKQIFNSVADIAATVVIWEAMTMFLVERKELRNKNKALRQRILRIEVIPSVLSQKETAVK